MHFRFYNTSRSLFMSFPVNIKILLLAFIHSINLKKAGVGQPKYCNNAYVHVVLTNLCRIFSTFVLLNIFPPLEMIRLKIWETVLPWHSKCPFPVAVRGSKTSRA